MSKIYSLLFGFIVFLCAAIVYYIANIETDSKVSDERDYRPSFIAKGLNSRVYDPQGTFLYFFKAKQMEYFKVSDVSSYIKPYAYNVFDNTYDKSWEVSADKGFFNTDEFITLSENVVVKNYSKNKDSEGSALRWWMNTTYLQLDINTSDISTDKLVHMYDPAFSENQGYDLVGNLETKKFTLKRDCHAIIQPEDFNQNN